MMTMTRRAALLAAGTAALLHGLPVGAQTLPAIHVVKDPTCPCCNAWMGHLRDNDFPVSFEERSVAALEEYKREQGVPVDLASCHTGTVEGYVLEGHVPAADIRRLLAERPQAVGLTVPGMPYGAPGMGPETERAAYEVILIGRDGTTSVFASYAAA